MILARAYLANMEPERAIATFSGLEEMQPESHEGPYLRGEVLLRQNKNREAREAYEIAQQRAPDRVPIVARLAVLDLREDDGDAAIARAFINDTVKLIPVIRIVMIEILNILVDIHVFQNTHRILPVVDAIGYWASRVSRGSTSCAFRAGACAAGRRPACSRYS